MKTLFLVTKYSVYDRSFIEEDKLITNDSSKYEDDDSYEVEELEFEEILESQNNT